ncbi:sialate O-acetylesterase [Pedobacter sp. CAN_A7]|uniref:sialate O-acetylesterase n=1 Tax=Pedobacter sp. CAN_A7 TaxID=2787722 RepID=UPI0018C959FF
MRKEFIKSALVIFMVASVSLVNAQVRLPKLFGNHMILQRDAAIPIWGTAKPGSQVVVVLNGKRVKTTAGPDGKWQLKLPAMKAGGPHTLSVFEGNNVEPAFDFSNVLLGDVWLASGQSNMEWQVQQSANAAAEIRNANFPAIRFFNVPHNVQVKPQDSLAGGSWVCMDTAGVKNASAVAYFFARDLHAELNVPIGIVQSTWGGTPVEAWTSKEQLLTSTITREKVLQNDTITAKHFIQDSLDLVRFWEIVNQPPHHVVGSVTKVDYNDSSWLQLNMPATLKNMNMPGYEGMMWLRKTINLPSAMTAKDLTIELGQPEMNYSLYFNGELIAKNIWNANPTHHYTIPAKLVKQGNNVIAIRMAFLWQGGGFNPPADRLYITDGQTKISMAGSWKYQKSLEPAIPSIKNYYQHPAFLYNGMINPVIPYGIKGFIWYQGENNVGAPKEYRTTFPMLIADWRARWKKGDLPFLYVQLANFMKQHPEPTESDWALLREAQTMSLKQPNTGMATAIDIGVADDIHPRNKQEVGRRLALLVKRQVYKKKVQATGPLYKSHKTQDGIITVRYAETGKGLTTSDHGKLKGFAIAGSDKKFYWANAVLQGNTVVLSSDEVKSPVAVRYAWADNPDGNLINKDGLPAVPFRTDID